MQSVIFDNHHIFRIYIHLYTPLTFPLSFPALYKSDFTEQTQYPAATVRVTQ